jgi:hypothetical protein
VSGGDFWDKVRALFISRAKAQFLDYDESMDRTRLPTSLDRSGARPRRADRLEDAADAVVALSIQQLGCCGKSLDGETRGAQQAHQPLANRVVIIDDEDDLFCFSHLSDLSWLKEV